MAKATAVPAPPERDETTIKVRCTGAFGYIDHKRRFLGDVFVLTPREGHLTNPTTGKLEKVWITAQQQFSDVWMEEVDARTPEKETSGPANLRKQHADILAMKSPQGMQADEPTGGANVLG